MNRLISYIICFLALSLPPAFAAEKQIGTIHVKVGGFRNSLGEARVNLYNSKEGFPSRPDKAFRTLTARIEDGEARVEFRDIPFGEYAVAVLHDENGNRKMDFNWLMIPKEGVGASNNPKGRLGPPSFDEARFRLESGEITINVRIGY